MIMEKGNQDLEKSIQKISNQNIIQIRLMLDQVLRRLKKEISIIEVPKNERDFTVFEAKILEKSKEAIEGEVKKVCLDNEKDEIIRLIQEGYEEQISILKDSWKTQKGELEYRYNNEILKKEKSISKLESEYKELQLNSNETEEKLVESLQEIEQEKIELLRMNETFKNQLESSDKNMIDSVELVEYRKKIENLEKLVEKLKSQNEQIKELKESISQSHDTSRRLIDLESSYKQKIKKIEEHFALVNKKVEDK